MVLGKARQAARAAKWTTAEWEEYRDKATEGDYDHLLGVTMEYFDVT